MKKLLIFELPIPDSEEMAEHFNAIKSKIENSSANDDFHIIVLPTNGNNIAVTTICPKVGL